MILKFTDDYEGYIAAGLQAVGLMQLYISQQARFMGDSKFLDKVYAHSIILSGIVDHLSNDDNSDPACNESLLLCLRSLVNKDFCKPKGNSVKFINKSHITS
tara:strand:- start:983 stop:1288 length:306 start_codon:yes stop_codon:yes gene_type:complete